MCLYGHEEVPLILGEWVILMYEHKNTTEKHYIVPFVFIVFVH